MFERLRSTRTRLALGGIALAALLAFAVVPLVAAASPTQSTPAGPTAAPASAPALTIDGTQPGALLARHPLLARTVRAELTVVKADGTTILVHFERGQVTAVSSTSITIQGRDGKGASFTVTDKTRVRANGHEIKLSDVKVGDRAMVLGVDQDGTYTAFLIRCVTSTAGS